MGDLIKLYEIRKPKIEMLLENEPKKTLLKLKFIAFRYFSEGNMKYESEIIKEYGSRFENSYLTVEKGEILLMYNDVPYFIIKTKQRRDKEKKLTQAY